MSNWGRQKIPIRKIPKKNHLQVTFSKRRAGLFKKASELCTLCGIEIAVIVFSPAGKVYSFGHPEVGPVITKFFAHPDQIPSSAPHLLKTKNAQLAQILTQLEAEREHAEMVGQVMKTQHNCWLTKPPVHELGLGELLQLRNDLEGLKLDIMKQQQQQQQQISLMMNCSSMAGYKF